MKAWLTIAMLGLLACSSSPKASGGTGGATDGGAGNGAAGTAGSSAAGTSGAAGNAAGASGAAGSAAGASGAGGVTVSYTCARELHVATNGNDANDGEVATPLRTISKATPLARPGDCVLVHAGTYAESATIGFSTSGTAAAPIVLRSADGRLAALIDAATNRTGETVLVHDDYIIIDGFEFRNSPLDTEEQVVHFDGLTTGKGVGSVLRNCKITGGYDHIKVNQASQGITVENNEFYGSFFHLPVSLTGANGFTFRHNFGHDWNTGDNGAVQLKGGSHDVVFDGNLFQDVHGAGGTIAMGDGCDATCDVDPDHYAAVRVNAINNVMLRVGRGFDVQGCKDCAILDNTIVDSGQGNVIFKLTSAITNGVTQFTIGARILDNLIANPAGDQGNIIQINAPADMGLQMDDNLAWNAGAAISWGDGHPATADAHSVTKAPGFVSATDFHLSPTSPARGAGVNLVADVPHDFDGTPRPATGAFDIGAFQSP